MIVRDSVDADQMTLADTLMGGADLIGVYLNDVVCVIADFQIVVHFVPDYVKKNYKKTVGQFS